MQNMRPQMSSFDKSSSCSKILAAGLRSVYKMVQVIDRLNFSQRFQALSFL